MKPMKPTHGELLERLFDDPVATREEHAEAVRRLGYDFKENERRLLAKIDSMIAKNGKDTPDEDL